MKTPSGEIECPICLQHQDWDGLRTIPYVTRHPIFRGCQVASCTSCKGAWVLTPPAPSDLKAYYHQGAYGENFLFRLLRKPPLTLERCQSLARWNFIRDSLNRAGKNLIQKEFSVCDIGGGFGCTYEVGKHQNLGIRYFAFESSPALRRRIVSLGGEVLGDFFEYEPNQSFDLVWASHILEHYPAPDDLLKKMRRMIKPDGAGFIEVPCLDYEFKGEWGPHLLFFSLFGLQTALERNGFDVLRADTVGRLRSEAGVYFQERMPSSSLKGRLLKILQKGRSIRADLEDQPVFDKWGLEVYGGDRCWIRAVFISREI